jgi:hypothetical protein
MFIRVGIQVRILPPRLGNYTVLSYQVQTHDLHLLLNFFILSV